MALFVFVVLPIGYAILGQLLGWATAASFFYSQAGKRFGRKVSRWAAPLLAGLCLLLSFAGIQGNAGTGLTLFSSQTALELLTATPFCGIPILAAYAGILYVIRDLTLGHEAAC